SGARSGRDRLRPRQLLPRAQEGVGRGDGLVETARVLAAGLREVGTAAAAAADERRELLDDVPGVVAADEVLRHRGEEQRALALLGEEALELLRRLLGRAAQQRADLAQERVAAPHELERRLAGRGLDAPDAGRHAALAPDLHDADVPRARDVGAAAQLGRE